MKTIWINDDLHEVYSKASKKVGRPMASIVQLILTQNINLINDAKKINQLFSMVNEKLEEV